MKKRIIKLKLIKEGNHEEEEEASIKEVVGNSDHVNWRFSSRCYQGSIRVNSILFKS